jgi:hypothetical protein
MNTNAAPAKSGVQKISKNGDTNDEFITSEHIEQDTSAADSASDKTHQRHFVVEMAPPSTRDARLFWAACRFGEIVAEGLLNPPLAEQVLTSAAHFNGLVRDDGLAQVKATIASGLTTGLAQPHPNHGES